MAKYGSFKYSQAPYGLRSRVYQSLILKYNLIGRIYQTLVLKYNLFIKILNNALYFDGSSDYVNVTNSVFDLAGNNFSISLWVYTTGYVNNGSVFNCIFARDNPFSATGYGIAISSTNKPQFVAGNVSVVSNTNIADGLHHIVAVHDTNTPLLKIYVDAVETTKVYNNELTSKLTASTYIGRDIISLRCLTGVINKVCVFNRILSAQEVSEIYSGAYNNLTGLLAKWELNDGSGSQANDTSGNVIHGTITGATWINTFLRLPSLLIKYNLFNSVNNSLILKYNIFNSAHQTLVLKYNLFSRVIQTLVIKYNLFSRVYQTLTLKYNLVGRVYQTLIIKYNLFNRVYQTLILKYNLFAQVLQTLIIKYNLFNRVDKTLIIKYHLRSLAGLFFNVIGKPTTPFNPINKPTTPWTIVEDVER